MQQALFDTTSAGYNILCDWVNTDCSTNIEQALVSIQKKQTSDLKMIDLKFTNDELFSTEAVSRRDYTFELLNHTGQRAATDRRNRFRRQNF